MNKLTRSVLPLALIFVAQGALACDYPVRANVPDGATATKEEMIAGQASIKEYMAKMEEYLSCMEAEEAAATLALGEVDEETTRRRNEIFNEKYNGAVDEMNRVAEEFNIQVRAYKTRSK